MIGKFFLNDKDAYTNYGITFGESAVTQLLTPAPSKDRIVNKSRTEIGSRTAPGTSVYDERELTLVMNLDASNVNEFVVKYSKFCDEILSVGYIKIKTSYIPNKVFRCYYNSCTQFSESQGLAKFSLKLTEYDVSNRKP